MRKQRGSGGPARPHERQLAFGDRVSTSTILLYMSPRLPGMKQKNGCRQNG
jgi:hypothetical protein